MFLLLNLTDAPVLFLFSPKAELGTNEAVRHRSIEISELHSYQSCTVSSDLSDGQETI